MKHFAAFFCIFCLCGGVLAQAQPDPDPRYLEDQFYVGLTYNLLRNRPATISQNNLSYGLFMGLIKDIPVNGPRTWALGIGLGYGVNSYYSNLRALESSGGFTYVNADALEGYRRNKLETHLVEMPIEIRWRSSNATDYKFWRIYGGVKAGYIVGTRSKYIGDTTKDSFYNPDSENLQYGLTLSVGYNTFNLHAYYGLNSLFQEGVTGPQGQPLEMAAVRVGLIFYIL